MTTLSPGSCSGDTYLRLYDRSTGYQLAYNDQYGGTDCSQITYTFYSSCRTYELREGCWSSYSCSGQVYYSGSSVSSAPTALPTTSPSNVLTATPSAVSTDTPTTEPTVTPTKVPSLDEDTLSGGEIAGIAIGSIAFVLIVVAGVAYYFLIIQPAATTAGTTAYTAASTARGEVYALKSPTQSPLVAGPMNLGRDAMVPVAAEVEFTTLVVQ
jgi:hypothetical protein